MTDEMTASMKHFESMFGLENCTLEEAKTYVASLKNALFTSNPELKDQFVVFETSFLAYVKDRTCSQ